jgi:hypothetical protein
MTSSRTRGTENTRPTGALRTAVRRLRWALPWICALALSASLAYAMNAAVAGSLSPAPEGPRTTISIAPDAATAVAANGDERALSPASLSTARPRTNSTRPSIESCAAGNGRLLYVGLNNWIPAEPSDASCADAGR